MPFCMFCENEAIWKIKDSQAPLCDCCREVYEAGQASPHEEIVEIDEEEDNG